MATDPTDYEDGSALRKKAAEDEGDLTAKAARCRRLAAGISDRQAAEVLNQMARNYQDAADRITERD